MAVEYLANSSRNTNSFEVFQSNDTRVQFHLSPFTYSLYRNMKGVLVKSYLARFPKERNDKDFELKRILFVFQLICW